MKLHRDLFPQVCSFENLHLTFREARRGKRDREEVAGFTNPVRPSEAAPPLRAGDKIVVA